jgi:hypothetical protein
MKEQATETKRTDFKLKCDICKSSQWHLICIVIKNKKPKGICNIDKRVPKDMIELDNPSLQPAKDNCSMDIESNNDKEPLIKNNQPLVNISQEVRRDYTQIEYSKEWFDKNQAHTIQDILYFKKNSCDNIIHIGEHFLLDLYPIYCNGTNRSATDVEIWEVENIEGKYYDKIRRDCFNYKPIRKITTGKQFNYPNGYWKIRDVSNSA